MATIAATQCSLPTFTGLKASSKKSSFQAQTKLAVCKARTSCELNTAVVISASTASLLFLGRIAFLPYHRASLAKAGLPAQNGVSHFEAGDDRAAENEGILKTNDPAGFTIVDVLGWGALGHAVGFAVLAAASNGYNPTF